MKVEIVTASSGKQIAVLENVDLSAAIKDIKVQIQAKAPKFYPTRQSLRLEPRGKSLKDDQRLSDLDFAGGNKLYFKDLGPQLGWSTVFFCEYTGPILVYLAFVPRPAFIYGREAYLKPRADVVWIAAACWSFHFIKRILETIFVHRFSRATMPIINLFKNCSHYWGFAALTSYFINHPLYTRPEYGSVQIYLALCCFVVFEYGNFVIHCALRDLRPAGSTVRKIPYPTSNPMTSLFRLVSCPNYTYEVGLWMCFTAMTQTLSGALFTFVGFVQMALWTQEKHQKYRKEFKEYPKSRKSIVPFLI